MDSKTTAIVILALVLAGGSAYWAWTLNERATEVAKTNPNSAPAPAGATNDAGDEESPTATREDDMDPGAALKLKVWERQQANTTDAEDVSRDDVVRRVGDYAASELERMEEDADFWGEGAIKYARGYERRLYEGWRLYTEGVTKGIADRIAEHQADFKTVEDVPDLTDADMFRCAQEIRYTGSLGRLVEVIVCDEEWRENCLYHGARLGKRIADDYEDGYGTLKRVIEDGG